MSELLSDHTARIFDIQRFSVHDGPGIRTTVFLKGCPLRCDWCQNPESQAAGPQLLLYADLCLDCGACAQVCPEMDGQPVAPPSRPATCAVCGRCVDVCPTETRCIAGREMNLDEVTRAVLRDRPFYGAQGGVTLGGGEPLAQWPFVRRLADRLRGEGVHVVLDTACAAPRAVVEQVPEHTDLVLADVKLVSPERHHRWTGADNRDILEAIRFWSSAMPKRLWISVPLIPGVQDEDEIHRIAEYVAALCNSPPVRLIPYHRLGNSKYAALGCQVPCFPGVVGPVVELARAVFHAQGIRVIEQGA